MKKTSTFLLFISIPIIIVNIYFFGHRFEEFSLDVLSLLIPYGILVLSEILLNLRYRNKVVLSLSLIIILLSLATLFIPWISLAGLLGLTTVGLFLFLKLIFSLIMRDAVYEKYNKFITTSVVVLILINLALIKLNIDDTTTLSTLRKTNGVSYEEIKNSCLKLNSLAKQLQCKIHVLELKK